jgi:HPr kinase/phosphorylase
VTWKQSEDFVTPATARIKHLLTPRASFLALELIAGKKGLNRAIETSRVERPWRALSGKPQSMSSGSIQLLGSKEIEILSGQSRKERKRALDRLAKDSIAALVVTDGIDCPSYLSDFSRRHRVPLLVTSSSPSAASRRIRRFLETTAIERRIVHGVLMDIYGLGILIVGESGIGKSEFALELIERGHRLVSDDIVEIYRDRVGRQSGDTVMGRSPPLTRYFMELRGLGIINVKDLFGPNSIRLSKSVDLVIQLERWEKATEVERLGLEEERYSLLGGEMPLVRMPVGPGRNLAMLIEVAARNHLLKQSGRHPARRLIKKVTKMVAGRQAGKKARK